MKTYLLALLAMVFIGAAQAAPPSVNVPVVPETKPGRIVVVTPKGDYEQSRWRLQSGVATDGRLVKPTNVDLITSTDGKTAYFASTIPGDYVILLTVWNKEGLADIEVRVSVVGTEPSPAPSPSPTPTPSGPTAKRIYVAVIRDPGNITPGLANIIGDTAFMNNAVLPGGDWDTFDHTAAEAEKKGYLNVAKKIQTDGTAWIPTAVILNRETGKVLNVIPIPATKDAFKAALDATKDKN